MRRSEYLNLIFFTFFLMVAWLRALPLQRRLEISAIGAVGIGLTFSGALLSRLCPSSLTVVVRDLLPAPLMILVYWQSGRFTMRPNEWIQNTLLRLDEKLISPLLQWRAKQQDHSWFIGYLELAYLLCYLLVPLGVCVLYFLEMQQHVDDYWMIVLLSTYLCYLPLPFFQMLPPRMLELKNEHNQNSHKLRTLNLGILKRASIHINTFPSAHVASTIAASLALISFVPFVGMAFLAIGLSIAGGAVLGRYHYAADAVLAIIFAGIVYFLLSPKS